jgi:hypothetical protein
LQSQGQHLPPQSVQVQTGFAVAVKAKATTAMSAKSIFFIFLISPLRFRSSDLPPTRTTEADAE